MEGYTMSTELVSALVAAGITLIGSLITFAVNKAIVRSEREKLERELQRGMTAKLYELRTQIYPEAIKLTEGLRKSRMTEKDKISEKYFQNILTPLNQWFSEKAFLLLSQRSVSIRV